MIKEINEEQLDKEIAELKKEIAFLEKENALLEKEIAKTLKGQ